MPELPEVEHAARLLAAHARGRIVRRVVAMHPALRRTLPGRAAARAAGRRIVRVERRAKHQLLHLDDGAVLHVHFRMSGDWLVGTARDATHPHARALIELDDETRIWLLDPRALATMRYVAPGALALPALGPEPLDPSFDASAMRAGFARRRGAVKPALLDQRIVSGIGNIYAVEALWRARIDPRTLAARLGQRRLARLADALRDVVHDAIASGARGGEGEGEGEGERDTDARFDVYDREGEPCRRCGRRIRRIVQAGRSTYFCPGCQR